MSVGTTKPRTPRPSPGSPVCAQMIATSARVASPIHRLTPSSTQSPPGSWRAVVVMEAGSEPAPGSVRPKQPTASPVVMRGSHCAFCSSEPCLWIAPIASEPCTETKVRRPESPASSSWAARPYSTAERPGMPWPS